MAHKNKPSKHEPNYYLDVVEVNFITSLLHYESIELCKDIALCRNLQSSSRHKFLLSLEERKQFIDEILSKFELPF